VIFAAAFFELCTHCCKPVLEDIDDRFADLGRRKGGSVYEPAPTIDFIFGADDHLIGVAIHPDKALGFLNPSYQIVDAHGLGLHWRPQRSNLAPFTPKVLDRPVICHSTQRPHAEIGRMHAVFSRVVDEVVRTELAGERLFVATAYDRDGADAELVLSRSMSEVRI
jgi:hypothetical protein